MNLQETTLDPPRSSYLGLPTRWVSQGLDPPTQQGSRSLGFHRSVIAIGQQFSFAPYPQENLCPRLLGRCLSSSRSSFGLLPLWFRPSP